MKKVLFCSYAAIFDLCVQQHGIYKALTAIENRVKIEKPSTQLDLMKVVVVERGKMASEEWVMDCISRKMGILTGAAYEARDDDPDDTVKRINPQLSLIKEHGDKYVEGL